MSREVFLSGAVGLEGGVVVVGRGLGVQVALLLLHGVEAVLGGGVLLGRAVEAVVELLLGRAVEAVVDLEVILCGDVSLEAVVGALHGVGGLDEVLPGDAGPVHGVPAVQQGHHSGGFTAVIPPANQKSSVTTQKRRLLSLPGKTLLLLVKDTKGWRRVVSLDRVPGDPCPVSWLCPEDVSRVLRTCPGYVPRVGS